MASHVHKFEKLNDRAIYCACGEIRTEPPQGYAPCSYPHYHWWYTGPDWTVRNPYWVTNGTNVTADLIDWRATTTTTGVTA